jgi:hypothetical protein
LFIAVAAFIAGVDGWEIVIMFVEDRKEWFRNILKEL